MSRKTDLSDDVTARICAKVRKGDRPYIAAQVEGVSKSSFFDWMRRGLIEGEGSPFYEFRNAIARAEAQFESEATAMALTGDEVGVSWGPSKASLEVLSRRFPKRWAPRVKQELEESNRLMLDALEKICRDPDVIKRCCEAKDCGVVFEAFCEELARLDSEGEAGAETGERAAPPEGGSLVH